MDPLADAGLAEGGSSPPPPLFSDSSSYSPPPPPSSDSTSSSPPPPPSSDYGSSSSSPPPDGSSPSGDSGSPGPSGSPGSHSSDRSSGSHKKSSSSSSGGSLNSSDVAGLVGAGIVILALIVACIICITRRRKKTKQRQQYAKSKSGHPRGGDKHRNPQMDHVVRINQGTPGGGGWGMPPPAGPSSSEFSEFGYQPSPLRMGGYSGKSQFTYEDLAAATEGFSEAHVLGQGGFGFVHKGVLPDGRSIAVKSLKAGSGQGEREFQAEVEIISRVHHRHLVSLVGYCISSDKRMLVYEFVPNKTLEFHLHGKSLPAMDWATRLRIALGSAKGLAYLHEDCHPRIIHRDIKSANILLDNNFEAMVADFGLAKLNSDNFTHVSTRVMGTFGYLAPEYAASGKLTEKSDVFSFGVMLVEIIAGRRPVDPTNRTMDDSLVDWARPLMARALEDSDYSKLVDPRLGENYVPQEMRRMVACANSAIRHSARRRPRMSQIVRALDGGSLDDLNETTKAAANQSPSTMPDAHADVYDTRAYNADIMKFRKMVISSQDDDFSSEYGSDKTSKP
ncbi:proline-rich receptor-like protein kinase PERK4 [Andrographis paniculata]|uniref:proline-rich receptor-like protein kinase PERK4 n=1 Tax=Andrographis paniculata TaxID=175694 RepID=UPI0021E770AC|nr:proline-rich receptor-like protein kinase PERK4 [Andrographis paniculata]XP_051126811.1 proline-rich receptor-like protein kinase PERK4 [Andrographis paniculata]